MDQNSFRELIYKRIFIGMWAALLSGIIISACLFIYVAKTKMPDTRELENPRFDESSIVFSADYMEIDRYFSTNRQSVKFDKLCPHLIDALIATEDHRFFRHSGIDVKGTARAFAFLGTRGGASTITQQLARQFFTPVRSRNPFKRVWQKMKEWVIAVEFERQYTKEEIIAMFLNKFDFIYNANGVAAAANVYFGKDQKDLTVDEAATLIGMLKNPFLYNPKIRPESSEQRRNIVLGQMHKHAFITREQLTDSKALPMDITQFRRGENYKGLAPYFMAELKKYIRELFEDEGIVKPGGEKFNLDSDGLRIYSTIDSRYQQHAEAAMKKHMAALQNGFFKHRDKSDPWTYNTNDQTQAIRNYHLRQLIEETDRYQKIRRKYINPVATELAKEVENVRLLNTDIKRLIEAERSPSYLSGLVKEDMIRNDQKKTYEAILESAHWDELKESWSALQMAVEADFNRPVEMGVFSHKGDVQKTMSPLDSIKYMSMFLQLGSMSMDPSTGYVKSWVGGIDYEFWKYDHVTSNRQVGSTFKPFLYTTALMNGYSPCYPVEDIQYTIPAKEENFGLMKSWSPSNSKGTFSEETVTLKEGLKQSLNSVSTWLLMRLGSIQEIISLAERMGIARDKIPPVPSIILGTPELSVIDMTTAYSTFANNGIRTDPVLIERIEDRTGKIIYQGKITQSEVIRPNINYAMVDMLKYASSVVSWELESEFGGKTGTTDDHVDGWFMGITPNLVVGTWVGGEYPWIRFLTISQGQGGVMARPFFIDFMKRIESDQELDFDKGARFTIPEDLGIELDCEKYQDLRIKKSLEDEFDEIQGQ